MAAGWSSYHINVKLALMYQAVYGVAFSIALGPLFDVYLFQIAPPGEGNMLVGKVESVSGLVALGLVIPVGWIVDKVDRVLLMKLAGVFGLISSVAGTAAIITKSVNLWYLTMTANGFYVQLGNSVCYALFADSVEPHARPKATSLMGIFANCAQATGPLMTFFSMLYLGNTWSTPALEKVLLFGMVIMNPICCIEMFFFKPPPFSTGGDGEGEEEAAGSSGMLNLPGAKCVPYLAAISDLITCIGAGMTIKYFNLYWKNEWQMTPTDVLAIAAIQPLAIAIFIKILERPAEACGRAQASCACFFFGAFAFIVLAKVHNLPVALFFYFIRSGMANSVYPLNKSIMFDFTPSDQRGRWNAIETLSGSVWSGSAFIGGYLSDSHGYSFTFMFTAGIYMFAMLIYSPLLGIVPRKASASAKSALSTPLMAGITKSPARLGLQQIASPAAKVGLQYQPMD